MWVLVPLSFDMGDMRRLRDVVLSTFPPLGYALSRVGAPGRSRPPMLE